MAFTVQADGSIKTDTLAEALEIRRALLIRRGSQLGGANRWANLTPERRTELATNAAASARQHWRENPGKGSISERRGAFELMVCIEGKARYAGRFETKEKAEAAQQEIVEARRAGLPLPEFAQRRYPRGKTKADTFLDELPAEEESPHAPIFPPWQQDAPTLGEGRDNAARAAAPATAPPSPDPRPPGKRGPKPGRGRGGVYETTSGKWRCRAMIDMQSVTGPSRATKAEAETDLAGALDTTRTADDRRAALAARLPALGYIFMQGARHVVEISMGGKHVRRGSFATRQQAEAAREETYQARLRGEPLPEFDTSGRRCSRCRKLGHTVIRCKADPATLPAAPPAPTPLPPPVVTARAAPTPTPTAPTTPIVKGSPEYRARVAEGMRRVWAARRAAKAGTCTESAISVQTPPARAPAQLPPRCVRCFRVGHVESECPRAALAFTEPGSVFTPEPERSVLAASDQVEEQEVPDDVTDWSGLLEPDSAPERQPELRPLAEAAGPTLMTPPPPVDLPPALLHLPVIADDGDDSYPDVDRPRTRADCAGQARPCPFVSCTHHLWHFRQDLMPWQMPVTCVLDAADRGPLTLTEIGDIAGLTRERIRQIETQALDHAARNARRRRMDFEAFSDKQSGAPEDVAPYTSRSD